MFKQRLRLKLQYNTKLFGNFIKIWILSQRSLQCNPSGCQNGSSLKTKYKLVSYNVQFFGSHPGLALERAQGAGRLRQQPGEGIKFNLFKHFTPYRYSLLLFVADPLIKKDPSL